MSAHHHAPAAGSRTSAANALRRPVDGDFYHIAGLVGAADQGLLRRVRAFAEQKVAPIINHYWGRAEFPFELIAEYGALGIAGAPYQGFGCPGRSALLDGSS
jgi:glutaryl-CoA dehydrogenase